jgi:hypothetical protein
LAGACFGALGLDWEDLMRRLVISFSGGETSAYMTWFILMFMRPLYDEIIIIFANTGQENLATLWFVHWCDYLLFRPLGFQVVWVEAVQQHGKRKTATHRVVDFFTADLSGVVFEDMIKKYGIPNQKFPHCTRDLKLAPIYSYVASLGWEKGSYQIAIGIRADEIDRMSETANDNNIIYPLIQIFKRTKPQINSWWNKQVFRLLLKEYQGNCRWCWKKTLRKHLTLIKEDASVLDFPKRMEEQYPYYGPEFRKPANEVVPLVASGYRRSFFRKNMRAIDIIDIYEREKETFIPAENDAIIYDEELDTSGGCGESCEVFSDDVLMSFEDEAA